MVGLGRSGSWVEQVGFGLVFMALPTKFYAVSQQVDKVDREPACPENDDLCLVVVGSKETAVNIIIEKELRAD